MSKTINIFNKSTWKNETQFFETVEAQVWEWDRCFNCDFCWDIVSEQGVIKDSIIECLWKQSWIQNIKIWESCWWHKLIKNYRDLRKWD